MGDAFFGRIAKVGVVVMPGRSGEHELGMHEAAQKLAERNGGKCHRIEKPDVETWVQQWGQGENY